MLKHNKSQRNCVLIFLVLASGCSTGPQSNLRQSFVPLNIAAPSAEKVTDKVPTTALPVTQEIADTDIYASQILETALNYSDDTSAAKSAIGAEKAAYNELKWEGLPTLVPTVNLIESNASLANATNNLNNREYRLALQQELFDFGRIAARSDQAVSRINAAQLEYWQEQNQVGHDSLEQFIQIAQNKKLYQISDSYVGKYQLLKNKIQSRLRAGVSDRSQLALIDIEIQQLEIQRENDSRAIIASESILESLTGMDIDPNDIPTNLLGKNIPTPVNDVTATPTFLLARQDVRFAKAEGKETKSSLLPRLVAEAYAEQVDGIRSEGVSLRLNSTSFAGFGFRSRLKTANSRIRTAQLGMDRVKLELDREFQRLNLEYQRLLVTRASLQRQKDTALIGVGLFIEQYESGVKPILDAIRVYENALNAERQLTQTQAAIQLNRIELANLMGTIAPYSGE